MRKVFTQKAFLLLTLLFVFFAAFCFAAFRQTEATCSGVKNACCAARPAKSNDVLWEVVSRQFLSLVSL